MRIGMMPVVVVGFIAVSVIVVSRFRVIRGVALENWSRTLNERWPVFFIGFVDALDRYDG